MKKIIHKLFTVLEAMRAMEKKETRKSWQVPKRGLLLSSSFGVVLNGFFYNVPFPF